MVAEKSLFYLGQTALRLPDSLLTGCGGYQHVFRAENGMFEIDQLVFYQTCLFIKVLRRLL